MAFVSIPRDLSRVKTKFALNLTKRQLICFSTAAAIGVPVYLFTRGSIGNSAAALLMIGLMFPLFFLAMYEKDGQPAEKILRNYIRARIYWPAKRPYRTENLYSVLSVESEVWNLKNNSTHNTPHSKLSKKEGNIIANQTKTAEKTVIRKRKTGKGKPRRR